MGRLEFFDRSASKKTVSLTINSDLTRRAKEAGINASQVAEDALAARLQEVSRAKLNEAAQSDIKAYNAYIDEHGLFADLVRAEAEDESGNAAAV